MAYKALKAVRGLPTGRDAMRMMQRMGMEVEEVHDVSSVVIKTSSKDIVIENPSVTVVKVQGQKTYQIIGGTISEEPIQVQEQKAIGDADIQLVAQQTGKSMEECKEALKKTEGDLARAILLLKGQEG